MLRIGVKALEPMVGLLPWLVAFAACAWLILTVVHQKTFLTGGSASGNKDSTMPSVEEIFHKAEVGAQERALWTKRVEDKYPVLKQIKELNGRIGFDFNNSESPVSSISLSGVPIPGEVLEGLLSISDLPELSISDSHLTDQQLSQIGKLKRLRSLFLWKTGVTDSRLKYLKGLTQLRNLMLGREPITGVGLRDSVRLDQIKQLHLAGTDFGDEGMLELKGMTRLEGLILTKTKVTDR